MKSSLCVLCALCGEIALLLPASTSAATTPVNYGLFGDVHVAAPQGEPRRTIVFFSDKNGWDARAESLAVALSGDGALVFGIDLPAYLKQMLSIKDACSFPSAHIQEMSDWMQRHQNLKNFSYPVLIGDGAGAAFAYAVDAQAPKGTFAALVTLGWDFSLRFPKPLCKGDAGEMSAGANRKFHLIPVATLPNRWLPLPFATGARRDGALAALGTLEKNFVSPPPRALASQAEAATELVQSVAWLTAPVAAAKPLPGDVADLPLIEVPARGRFAQRIAIILTGDGGWAGLDVAVADQLAARGIAVVGLNTSEVFLADAHARGGGRRAHAHHRPLRRAASRCGFHRHRLFVRRRPRTGRDQPLAEAARARIAAQVLISPDAEAVFEIHVGDWFGSTASRGRPAARAGNRAHQSSA